MSLPYSKTFENAWNKAGHWKYPVGIGLVLGFAISAYNISSDEPEREYTPQEQATIRKLEDEVRQMTVSECGPTRPGNNFWERSASEGSETAVGILEEIYTDPQELAEVLQFFKDNRIRPHAVVESFGPVFAAFFNAGDRTLLLKTGAFSEHEGYFPALKQMIEKMRTGDMLGNDALYVIFKNKDGAYDTIILPHGTEVWPFPANPDAPALTRVEADPEVWTTPCADTTITTIYDP